MSGIRIWPGSGNDSLVRYRMLDAAKQFKSGRACIGDHLFIGVADSKSKVASEQVKLLSSAELERQATAAAISTAAL